MVASEPSAQQEWFITEADVDAALDFLFAEDKADQQGYHSGNQDSSQPQTLAPWGVEGQSPYDGVDLQAILSVGAPQGKILQPDAPPAWRLSWSPGQPVNLPDSGRYMQSSLEAPGTYSSDGTQKKAMCTAHLTGSKDCACTNGSSKDCSCASGSCSSAQGSSGKLAETNGAASRGKRTKLASSAHGVEAASSSAAGAAAELPAAMPAALSAAAGAAHHPGFPHIADLTPSKPGKAKGSRQAAYKDQKRNNRLLIQQLEEEVQQKLVQLHVLESANQDLKRKERLLQLSVASTQQGMAMPAELVGPTLASFLKSFKGASNKAQVDELAAKLVNISKPGDISFETMRKYWCALVMELGDALMAHDLAATPEARAAVEEHIAHINAPMLKCGYAMGLHNTGIKMHMVSRNLYTGEELDMRGADDAWNDVVAKINLTPEQVKDLAGVFEVFVRCMARNTSAITHLLQQLQEAVDKRPALDSVVQTTEVHQQVAKVLPQLQHAMARVHLLHLMVAHMTMNILTPVQGAGMVVHAMPRFGSARMLVQTVHHAHVGVDAHNLLLESHNYSALTGGWDPSSASALLATAATIASKGGAASASSLATAKPLASAAAAAAAAQLLQQQQH